MEFVSCDPSNYRAGRTQPVRYIVMHYTANNGDTARNNCDYYHRVGGLQASAHYFVDEHGAMQSVREGDTALRRAGVLAPRVPQCQQHRHRDVQPQARRRQLLHQAGDRGKRRGAGAGDHAALWHRHRPRAAALRRDGQALPHAVGG